MFSFYSCYNNSNLTPWAFGRWWTCWCECSTKCCSPDLQTCRETTHLLPWSRAQTLSTLYFAPFNTQATSQKLPLAFRRSFSNSESFMFPAAAFFFMLSCTYISAKWVRELIATENQYLLICDAIMVEHSRLLWSKQGSVMFLLNCIYSCLHRR